LNKGLGILIRTTVMCMNCCMYMNYNLKCKNATILHYSTCSYLIYYRNFFYLTNVFRFDSRNTITIYTRHCMAGRMKHNTWIMAMHDKQMDRKWEIVFFFLHNNIHWHITIWLGKLILPCVLLQSIWWVKVFFTNKS
jgi:hypothetical protein